MLHPTIDDDWYILVEFIICIFNYALIQIWILNIDMYYQG